MTNIFSSPLIQSLFSSIVTLIIALVVYIIGSFIISKILGLLSRPLYLALQKVSKNKLFTKARDYQSLIITVASTVLQLILFMLVVDILDFTILNTIVAGVTSFFADLVKIASFIVGGALAIAFGLGGKDYAKKIVDKKFPKIK